MGSISKPGELPPARLLRSNAPPSTLTPTPQQLFNTVRRAILESHKFNDLSFENISADCGQLVTTSLSEDPDVENACPRISYNSHTKTLDIRVMPTLTHDIHQPWIVMEMSRMVSTGFVTQQESDSVRFLVGTSILSRVSGPVCRFIERARYMHLSESQSLPSLVIETGWSESWPKLGRDKDLWLQGGFPEVQLVLLIKWSKISSNRVKGTIEIHGRNGGVTQLLQTEAIFPVPTNSTTQSIPISREQFLGQNVSAGGNATQVYQLSMDRFRELAEESIRSKGLTPA
ncbi:hypothetical protein MGYG_02791 [Nannizzia gypsea CBS 118893]|uniref:Uncharacterized protein n=1 Tax=Arthroderma gypseum (strain ATCC MYA-4604 / CBS 118893) TaxID=535722 RepID=E4UP25_ARTGP|nr:hypothetical protein MGYG_02791 [Nannizzia gypsea CBS 118893]EFQ99778.1 hypothetical protein MGYG_02791 [Nannizzia gypsea CBS 118893]